MGCLRWTPPLHPLLWRDECWLSIPGVDAKPDTYEGSIISSLLMDDGNGSGMEEHDANTPPCFLYDASVVAMVTTEDDSATDSPSPIDPLRTGGEEAVFIK